MHRVVVVLLGLDARVVEVITRTSTPSSPAAWRTLSAGSATVTDPVRGANALRVAGG
jgi:hypothetical protein